jgi:hypothetical protein
LQLDKLLSSSREILQIPPELDMIVPTNVPEGKSVPLFNENYIAERLYLEYQNCVQGLESMAYTQQLLNQDHTCLNSG